MDPIDWATYESYLYANKERFASRCQVGRRSGCGPHLLVSDTYLVGY